MTRNENETMIAFNILFYKIIQDIPQSHQPTPTTILLYYLNSFQGQFNFFLNEANTTYLVDAKKKAKNIDDNWVLAGKPDILTPPRARVNPKSRTVHTTKPSLDPLATIMEGM